MSAPPTVVSIADLAAFAAGSASIVEKAQTYNAEDETPTGKAEYDAVRIALKGAEGFGTRWLGFDADTLHVQRRTDAVFVMEPLATTGPQSVPYAYGALRPVVQVNALDGADPGLAVPTADGRGFTLPLGTPGAYVSADTFAGYAPTDATTADLRQIEGLEALSPDAVVPMLPGPLLLAVCESALAALTRAESGALGKTESSFQISTQVRTSVRLVADVMGSIWSLHARGYRVLS